MEVKFDFHELTDFGNRLKGTYSIDTRLMTATQKIARVLHSYLLQNTPIVTGNLRKMWSAGNNLNFTVERVQNGYKVTLINTARNGSKDGFMYGLSVNDGHGTSNGGWVMGRFFVEKSIVQTVPQVEQVVMTELRKWWDSV